MQHRKWLSIHLVRQQRGRMHGFLNRDAPDKQGHGGKDRPVGPQQLNMLGLRSKASPFQYIAQPNSCPFRIPDRSLLPLRSRNFRAEEGSTVTRTLYDCVKRHRFKRLQVRKRERDALLDIPFHMRSEEHTSELQSLAYLVCRLLLEKKKEKITHAVS